MLFKLPHTESAIKLNTSSGWATQGPNESIKTVVLSVDHCKTAAGSRNLRQPPANRRKKLTFPKMCAKPQREAKKQSATDPLIPLGGGLGAARGAGRGHQAKPPGEDTRRGRQVRPPGEATRRAQRRGHKARPRGEATRQGHDARPRGEATRRGHEARSRH